MSFYNGVLVWDGQSAKIKPVANSKRMPLLEFVGCEPLLGGSKKFGVIRRTTDCQSGNAIVAEELPVSSLSAIEILGICQI